MAHHFPWKKSERMQADGAFPLAMQSHNATGMA